MGAYYNENDPYCVQWLRNLIAEGLIADGDVDGRDIRDVKPEDLRGYRQVHFFAGLGGWSRALRLAEWADDEPAWTGSCPCQPFSVAGKRAGTDDPRHLWPEFRRLVSQRKPTVVFGEQVAGAKVWLDAVLVDLEAFGYACGAAIVPAAGVGAPHKRDRLWFVAHANGSRQLQSGRGKRHERGRPSNGGADVADANKLARHEGGPGNAAEVAGGRDAYRGGVKQNGRNANGKGLALRESLAGDNGAEQSAALGASWWTTEPGMGRVAHGIPARVAKLRALGNAIVPQVAAEFIAASREAIAGI